LIIEELLLWSSIHWTVKKKKTKKKKEWTNDRSYNKSPSTDI
jgi:hypothetical protein